MHKLAEAENMHKVAKRPSYVSTDNENSGKAGKMVARDGIEPPTRAKPPQAIDTEEYLPFRC